MDISEELATETGFVNFWNPTPAYGATIGVLNQLQVALGTLNIDWRYSTLGPVLDQEQAIKVFLDFFNGSTNVTNLVMQAPFTPTAKLVQWTTWEANDPFVH